MEVRRVGVIGSGTMGRGIATVLAAAGYDVTVRSRSDATAGSLLASIQKNFDRQVDKGALSAADRDAAMARVQCTSVLNDLDSCDFVIESIIEDRAAKAELFAELDRVCGDDVIFASNTSTFPITELAAPTTRPHRICGMHFFNPVPVMPLVEVAKTLLTDDDTIATAVALAETCGKRPVVVEDVSGFVVNQILFAYLSGALRLLNSSSTPIEDIDAAMRGGCNFPMGPFELMDLVGIDVCMASFDELYAEYREPQFACPPVLRRMVSAGRLGRKSGRGFYAYR
jgi:3-hydroxybutyryl-CoA dehydrogenase